MSETESSRADASHQYGAEAIRILEGLEAVRVRPAMYIGSTGEAGLHHLVYEVVDNSVDEALAGHCSEINVTIHIDNSVTVVDDGRGIPVGLHRVPGSTRPRWSSPSSTRAASSTRGPTRSPAGCTASGISVVNALSENLDVEIRREGKVYRQTYSRGVPADPPGADRGHRPARHEGHLQARRADLRDHDLQLRHALPAPARAVLPQPRHPHHPRGRARRQEAPLPVRGRHRLLRRAPQPEQGDDPREARRDHGRARRRRRRGGPAVERRLRREHPLLREQHQHPRRRHPPRRLPRRAHPRPQRLRGRGRASSRTGEGFEGEDCREGLCAVISVKVPNPQFEGQTKGKLGNSEVKGIVESLVNEQLSAFLEENPPVARRIVGQDPRRRARARGRAQGARPHPPQGRPRRGGAARQARRVPGAEPRELRAVPGGGRLGRRLRQAGPRPRLPGDPAAARQDPERGEGAPRQDARLGGDPQHHHRARHRASAPTTSTWPSCATTASSSCATPTSTAATSAPSCSPSSTAR